MKVTKMIGAMPMVMGCKIMEHVCRFNAREAKKSGDMAAVKEANEHYALYVEHEYGFKDQYK